MTFEEWFGAQLPSLLRFTTVLCGGPDPAEEVLQDVALKALRRWDSLRDLEHPEAYLRRMIVNEHLSWRRKWARLVPQAELREPGPTSGGHFADQHADRAELMVELNKTAAAAAGRPGAAVLRGPAGCRDRRTVGLQPEHGTQPHRSSLGCATD